MSFSLRMGAALLILAQLDEEVDVIQRSAQGKTPKHRPGLCYSIPRDAWLTAKMEMMTGFVKTKVR